MKALEERILKDGKTAPGDILRVDSFVNHQIDIKLLSDMADCFCEAFTELKPDKIVTVEASGIAIATAVALKMGLPLVFAKKAKTANITDDNYKAECFSYTHGSQCTIMVSKDYLHEGERILILDDFLANGQASLALISLCEQAKATCVGVGIIVEKSYQAGRSLLEEKGIKVESLARIESMSDDGDITFVK